MSNRIFAAVGEGVVEPDWTEAAVQFMEKAAELLKGTD